MDKIRTLAKIWDNTDEFMDQEGFIEAVELNWSLLKTLGIKLDSMYACGNKGCAFPTKSKVVTAKITNDPSEIAYYKLTYEHQSSILPRIAVLEKFPHQPETPTWWVVMREAIDPLPFIDADNFDRFMNSGWRWIFPGSYSSSSEKFQEFADGLASLAESGVSIYDVNTKNIGISKVDGRFVLFDAGTFW